MFRLAVVLLLLLLPAQFLMRHFLGQLFSEKTAMKVGAVVESFSLPDSSGVFHSLDEYMEKNNFVALHFWATWCPSCRNEMPNVVKFQKDFLQQGVEVVAISVDRDIDELDDYLKKYALPFPVLSDGENSIMEELDVSYLPTTILISKDRRVLARDNDIADIRKSLLK